MKKRFFSLRYKFFLSIMPILLSASFALLLVLLKMEKDQMLSTIHREMRRFQNYICDNLGNKTPSMEKMKLLVSSHRHFISQLDSYILFDSKNSLVKVLRSDPEFYKLSLNLISRKKNDGITLKILPRKENPETISTSWIYRTVSRFTDFSKNYYYYTIPLLWKDHYHGKLIIRCLLTNLNLNFIQIAWFYGNLALFSLFFILLITFKVADINILKPMESLIQLVNNISKKGYTEKINHSRNDEFSRLYDAFNEMVDSIQYHRNQLENEQKISAELNKFKAIGSLSASMAHEIKNPLTGLKMGISLIKRDADSDEHEILKRMMDEINRLNSIVQGILDFSKPKTAFRKEISFSEVLEKTLFLVQKSLTDNKIELIKPLEDTLVFADTHQIQQVLLNLFLNAIDALKMVESKRKITISTEKTVNMVYIKFSDNGNGIKKEHEDKIFTPFYSTKKDGFGHGLSICSKLIAMHGGAIFLTENNEKGVEFTLSLPLQSNGGSNETEHTDH